MPVKVKICGITNPADGMAAAEAGADALGFVFCDQSPRRIAIEAASMLSIAFTLALLVLGPPERSEHS